MESPGPETELWRIPKLARTYSRKESYMGENVQPKHYANQVKYTCGNLGEGLQVASFKS